MISAYLQHVEESRLSGIIKSEEEEFGVLVQESQAGKDIPDCGRDKLASFHHLLQLPTSLARGALLSRIARRTR